MGQIRDEVHPRWEKELTELRAEEDRRGIHGPVFRTVGSILKERRLRDGLTLREFCLKYGYDPVTISKLERSEH